MESLKLPVLCYVHSSIALLVLYLSSVSQAGPGRMENSVLWNQVYGRWTSGFYGSSFSRRYLPSQSLPSTERLLPWQPRRHSTERTPSIDVVPTRRGRSRAMPVRASDSETRSVAERVLADMDLSVHPCEDFYRFACGGFLRNASTPNGIQVSFLKPKLRVDRILIAALEEPINNRELRPFSQAKIMYKTCMEESLIERIGAQDLLAFIRELGGWPILGSRAPGIDLVETLAKVRRLYGGRNFPTPQGVLVGMSIQTDYQESSKFAIYMDEGSLGQRGLFGFFANRDQYLVDRNDVLFTAYRRYIWEISLELGAPSIQAWRDVVDMVGLETHIARIGFTDSERRELTTLYKKFTIRELTSRYPEFNWLRFISTVVTLRGSRVQITLDTKVYAVRDYFDRLFVLLDRYSERTIANYVVFRGIQALLLTMNKQFRDITDRYEATISGSPDPQIPTRNVSCSNLVTANYAWVTGRLFVDRGFTARKQREYLEITENVRQAYIHLIATSTYLSEPSRRKLINKMLSIKSNIGFPDFIFDRNFFETFYQFHRVEPLSLLKTMRNALEQNFVQEVNLLVSPELERWQFSPTFVNAVSILGPVSIEMLAAILDEPFFSLDYPASMKFGGIGFIIGHEYTHQFDRRYILVNGRGQMEDLLSRGRSRHDYDARTNCIVRHYRDFVVPEANRRVPAVKTLLEDMADLGGLQAGYLAFKQWQARTRQQSRVSGLPFTGDQLYFINEARIWCAKFTPEYARRFLLSDAHSLDRYRVYGPVRNSQDFADAFNCPVNSPMNPPNKCVLW